MILGAFGIFLLELITMNKKLIFLYQKKSFFMRWSNLCVLAMSLNFTPQHLLSLASNSIASSSPLLDTMCSLTTLLASFTSEGISLSALFLLVHALFGSLEKVFDCRINFYLKGFQVKLLTSQHLTWCDKMRCNIISHNILSLNSG